LIDDNNEIVVEDVASVIDIESVGVAVVVVVDVIVVVVVVVVTISYNINFTTFVKIAVPGKALAIGNPLPVYSPYV
jgi:hypothetical protein